MNIKNPGAFGHRDFFCSDYECGKLSGSLFCTFYFAIIEQVVNEFALAPGIHQIGLSQDAQMLRSYRLLYFERIINFMHTGSIFVVNDGADAHSQGVGQRTKNIGRRLQMRVAVKKGGGGKHYARSDYR